MIALPADFQLPADDHKALALAVDQLERSSLATRIAEVAGQPINRVLALLPQSANRRLTKPLEAVIFRCLEIAIGSLQDLGEPPQDWMPRVMAGLTGAVAGFFGAVSLPLELPLTTTLMLRAIAEIARDQGEDLRSLATGLACLEVFALGGPNGAGRTDIGYYATRAVTARLAADVTALAVRRGTVDAASPAAARMVAEIASRFGFAVSERALAGAVPVIGALGGATVNVMFMRHFQSIARGHFVIRRLERRYGEATVRALYCAHAVGRPPDRRR